MKKFFPDQLSLIVLLSACSVILISMGLRQTFGLFFEAFENGLGVTRTEFGLAIGIQMLFWGFRVCNIRRYLVLLPDFFVCTYGGRETGGAFRADKG